MKIRKYVNKNSDGFRVNYYTALGKIVTMRPPLVLLHGFTGNGISWKDHIEIFAKELFNYAPDAYGHGESDAPSNHNYYSVENATDTIFRITEVADFTEKMFLLGYSMGGRTALHIAVNHPEMVEVLILESASPGIKDAAERQKRIESDNVLADFIEREGIEAFVDYWEQLPLWDSQKRLPQEVLAKQREQRLKNNPLGLANSLRGAGAGVDPPLHDQLYKLTMPVLIIAGELDSKYVAIGREMKELIPHARLEIVPEAGHNVHLEQPAVFNKLVLNFLNGE
jgi:2-succinyl-6-hydroxy-2,4-cyclohexadiene-1-carboxylate synthase